MKIYIFNKMIEPIEFLKEYVNQCANIAIQNAPEDKKSRKSVNEEQLWLPIFNNLI